MSLDSPPQEVTLADYILTIPSLHLCHWRSSSLPTSSDKSEPKLKLTSPRSLHSAFLPRLVQLNVKTIFGVSGDFNLGLLDYIEDHPDITWAGNAGELGAAYAADGYARIQGFRCLVTTFGVGELSALNGIAGAMAERVPILHIVGSPSNKAQASGAMLHHTLGEGRFDEFEQAASHFAVRSAKITKADGAGEVIDTLIHFAFEERRPVYLNLPSDVVHFKVPSGPLRKADPFPKRFPPPPFAVDDEITGDTKIVVDHIVSIYEKAKDPVLLFDGFGERFKMSEWTLRLAETLGIRYCLTCMSQASLPERHPLFAGIYFGECSLPGVAESLEKSDCVISVGLDPSDMNTGVWSWKIRKEGHIDLQSDKVTIGSKTYSGVSFRDVLPALVPRLSALPRKAPGTNGVAAVNGSLAATNGTNGDSNSDGAPISHADLWKRVSTWMREDDIVRCWHWSPSPTPSVFGPLDYPFPLHATYLIQWLWCSIGWSVGATLGALCAVRDSSPTTPPRRVLLFVGDGALQMTLQEIGTMFRQLLSPTIFVLNNNGYEVEKVIHGPTREYNNIQPYDHAHLLALMAGEGREEAEWEFERVRTVGELEEVMGREEFRDGKKVRLVDVRLKEHDAPRAAYALAKGLGRANAKVAEAEK